MIAPPIPRPLLLAYAAPALPLALLGITFYVILPKFYADVVGVDLTALGVVILLSRVWDALTDPLIGQLSDGTRTRWGRRRPWMLAAAVPLAAVFVALVAPSLATGPSQAVARLAVLTFVFFLLWTMVAVPYEALGVEVSLDHDQRTRLLGTREGAVVLGTLLAAAVPVVVTAVAGAPVDGTGQRDRLLGLGVAYSAVLLGALAACAFAVQEPALRAGQRPAVRLLRALPELLRNRPFRVLLTAYTVSAFGAALPATLIFFYVEHVLGSSRGPEFLVLYLGLGLVLVPAWVGLARRWEKKHAWLLAMAVNTTAFAGVLVLGPGDGHAYGVLVALSAVGLGGTLAIPPSMQGDVIDVDEFSSGVRREGAFIGAWSVGRKLAAALGAGLAFPILDAAGYVAVGPQPPEATLALRLLYAGVPCACNLAAIAIAWRYPVDRATHAAVRAAIDARALGTPMAT